MIRFAFAALVLLSSRSEAQDLNLVSYNIRYDNPADGEDRWELRKASLADAVLRERPAIIGLQEALAHQLASLDSSWTDYRRFGVGRDDGLEKGEFAPVYYDTRRFTGVSGRTIWLSSTPDAPSKGWDAACERIATLVVLREHLSGDSLIVVNTHWDHEGELARRESAALLLRILEPSLTQGKAVLLLGDLNAEPGSVPIQTLSRSLMDACPGSMRRLATFNGFKPDADAVNRIDYIWHDRKRWRRKAYRVVRPKVNGRQSSDHFMIVATLSLRE